MGMDAAEVPAPALTLRAVGLGALLGVGLGVANLMVGLKVGLSVGVALTAVAMAAALRRLWRVPLSLAEGAVVQSVASAAGYSTGSALASAGAAYVLSHGQPPSVPTLVAWTGLVAVLGCLMAWPLREAFLLRGGLPFPSGTAAAVALRSLWGTAGAAVAQVRALAAGAVTAGGVAVAREGGWLSATWLWPGAAGRWGFGLELAPFALGAGALLGGRLALSLVLGAVLTFAVFGPWGAGAGLFSPADWTGALGFALWPGTALFSGAALAHFALQVWRWQQGPGGVRGWGGGWPWALTSLGVGGAVAAVGAVGLGIPWGAALVAVALAFPLCLISCRVTGESDVTPSGPLGQLTQVMAGPLTRGDAVGNVMAGGLTAAAAASAADLMTDWKTGHLLSVEPGRQFLAQLIGCGVGAAAVAPLFAVVASAPGAFSEGGFAVPAARMFLAVGEVVARGTQALPAGAGTAAAIAVVMGVTLAVVEARWPKVGARLPSPVAVGLAMMLPPALSFALGLGGLGAAWARWRHPARAEVWLPPAAAGLIAGEALVAAALALAMAIR